MPDHVATASRIARRLAAAFSVLAALDGCAPAPAPEAAQAAVAHSHTEMQESPICRPDPALLTPQSAPDCKFGRLDLKTLDPDQWARLKIEYERQCYQRAEKAVRGRLRLLQLALRCDAGMARRQ
ncbi:MAG TPA: hypothetical protein VKR55_15395 [Bradyrhizobium sp.]|uniref:hypothetical protein n=1 Tax=Bradyrhizobium sp. TaxID=376 RepID=UPI002B955B98|nr:hypothetical protein [Bradyrhizobium sp.]HLZ03519.1 hypothetical protein [Bradyrhizobium sp.]